MIKIETGIPLPDSLRKGTNESREEIEIALKGMKVGQSFVIEGYRLKTVRKIAAELGIAVRTHALDKKRSKARVHRVPKQNGGNS